MTRLIALLGLAIVLVWPIRMFLLRARWTELTPRAAIVLWQSVGAAFGVAILGACFELATLSPSRVASRRGVTDFTASAMAGHASRAFSPNQLFGLTAGLVLATLLLGSLTVRAVGLSRARARQRLLIDLLGSERLAMPGALVVEHSRPTAFTLPGLRPRLVVSSGAIDALSGKELAAVLAHERAHVRARHDLVLLPFSSLSALLPRCRAIAKVSANVTTLVEMAADDRALRQCDPNALARALCAMAIDNSATSERSGTGGVTVRRVKRLLADRPSAKLSVCASTLSALGLLALPFLAMFAPLGAR